MKTNKAFSLFLIILAIQIAINNVFKDYLTLGIVPVLFFWIFRTYKIGRLVIKKMNYYNHLKLKKFKVLTIASLMSFSVYILLLNFILWPPNSPNENYFHEMTFLLFGNLLFLFLLYAIYFNVNLTANLVAEFTSKKYMKTKVVLALIFFPVGMFWLDRILEE